MRTAVGSSVVLLPVCVLAQSFDRLENGFVPEARNPLQIGIAAADLDGDGDIDFVLGGRAWYHQLLINDGEGRFDSILLPWTLGNAEGAAIAAADLDGDGDAEILLGTTLDPIGALDLLLWNDGSLNFTPSAWAGNGFDRTTRILTVDIDDDGDTDVLNLNSYPNYSCPSCNRPPSRLFRNNGGQLALAALFPQPPSAFQWDVGVIDYDGDGIRDVLFGGPSPQLYRGLGLAQFASTPIGLSGMESIHVADLDGDGDDDLVTSTAGTPSLRRNDGSGIFTQFPLPAIPGTVQRVQAADLDGDGLPDLAIESDHTHLLRNTGNLVFVDVSAVWLEAPSGPSPFPFALPLSFQDLDGDGDIDLLDGRSGLRILWNDGTGRLAHLESFDPFFRSQRAILQAADLDGDGHLDLLGFDDADNAAWWRRDAFGRTAGVHTFDVWSTDYRRSLSPFDADGDGDTDILLDTGIELRLLRNDGTGGFVDDTAAALPVDPRPSGCVEVGDLDGDGDLDILIGRGAALQDSCYENDGRGHFVDVGPARFVDSLITVDFAIADFDGDGDLDVATGSAPVLLFENDGTGTFVDVTSSRLPAVNGHQLIAADVDGDGDPDLVVVTSNGVALLRNDAGTFTDQSQQLPAVPNPAWPLAGDIDADGDVDLRIGNTWLVNDGTGTFVVAGTPLPAPTPHRCKRALVDLDGDGDADSLRGGIAYNLHRQLESALPPRLGFHGELRLHARTSVPGFTPFAALALAPALAPTPVPIGTFGSWRLDPSLTFVHSSHVIATASGHAAVRYLVPAQPSLLGVPLYAQALTATGPSPSQWRAGNALSLWIRR